MKVSRLPQNPIITPALDPRMGENINGPSLIRAPEWLTNRLGEYYLYFGHHQGEYIRLAYADRLEGPWTVYSPGTLQLEQTPCFGHIASPDVHVDEANRRLVMYYHGPFLRKEQLAADPLHRRYPAVNNQRSFVAFSDDGIHFTSNDEMLGPSYLRLFRYGEWTYALGMPGIFFRSRDGITGFETGPALFSEDQRHTAVLVEGDTLSVFYTQAGDCPEQILCATIDLSADWNDWQAGAPASVLLPEMDYEGAALPLEPSQRGAIHSPARQLRDPAIFQEGGRTFLLYSVAGESGIAIAELHL